MSWIWDFEFRVERTNPCATGCDWGWFPVYGYWDGIRWFFLEKLCEGCNKQHLVRLCEVENGPEEALKIAKRFGSSRPNPIY